MSIAAIKRKLAAIVCMDICGYSALAESDQDLAATHVARIRDRLSSVANTHAGRIFSTAGDGAMMEFGNASDALNAAITLCEAERDPPLRLGVHMDEVVVAENGDLLGHGVNVAARLQSQAENGGVLVSQVVHDSVSSSLARRLYARGQIKLAKMRAKLRVYAWSPPGAQKRAKADTPVLAVLPFDNRSGDADTQFFSDGVSEEILYSVSRMPGLQVIGSTSSFAFRGRDKPKAAKALGATHVLDGSVRRDGAHVRITAQLNEAEHGTLLWSERYDRELDNAFALQEEIAREAAKALELALGEAKRARTQDLTAGLFDEYLRAREHLKSGATQRVAEAAHTFESIVRRAPDFARAWTGLASAKLEQSRYQPSLRARLRREARDAADQAIGIDDTVGEAFAVLAALESEFGRWHEREALLERALRAEPNNPHLFFRHGQTLVSVGRVAAGYAQQARAFELDPLDPMFAAFYGFNVWATRSRPEGRAIFEDAAKRAPENIFLWYLRLSTAALEADFATADALRAQAEDLLPGLQNSPIIVAGRLVQDMLMAPSPEAYVQLGEAFTTMAEAQPSCALDLGVALSVLGMTEPALALLEEALDNIEAWRDDAPDALRPHVGYETALLFIEITKPLRMNLAFPRLCARIGLARFWSESGVWPDCVAETAPLYDFKAECLRLL
ncbi:MAG: hypothetical protein ABUL73_04775 [Alphaproteobacteria bacterium]